MTRDLARERAIIDELWQEVRPAVLVQLQELVADAERFRRDPADLEAWTRVRSTTHRLAGTLGSFGQQPAGDTAVALDRVITGIEVPDEATVARAATLIAELQAALPVDGQRPPA